ncbi:hypothetical protein SK571_20985 [Lentzea sp. BCCO 10_0798]|jgi:hypothetical protein|uniref:Subtilisin inhibitor-like n=1 Tax=Lentzea kristufekii TaxID=3095430 RepID=A0ABU4TU90_9PSEU|nr:hypothetical protein [Lentzea sp. BCCO 10_0798]MDX8051874.1 hypothetical protein [Lentzea sp. BCCO 10_0798]
MGRFLVALAVVLGFAVLSTPLAHAAPGTRWEIAPCASGSKALWLPRVDKFGTDLSCTTEEARSAAVKAAVDSGSPKRMANVAIAAAQQLSDKSLTATSPCVLGAKGAIGEAIGTCVAA